MNIRQTEAMILQTRDYGESDRLITFYTRTAGKLKGIAKGARRSRKRFIHAFEPCSLVELTYKERKSLIWIEACKLTEPHLALRAELERWVYSALICEIILEMVPEAEREEDLFDLFKGALDRLAVDRDPLNIVLLFMLRFLDITGYLPSLDCCSVCRTPVNSSTHWWWRVGHGTLACAEHRSVQTDQFMVDLGTLALIRKSRQLPLNRIWRLHVLQERKPPLLHALAGFIRDHIRQDLKSLRLLEQVQSG
ncbi:MAG: DNA repair protein RecO [Syntrophobacteraceae bacterium]